MNGKILPEEFLGPESAEWSGGIDVRPQNDYERGLLAAAAQTRAGFDINGRPFPTPGQAGGAMALTFSNGFTMPGDYSGGLPGQSSGDIWGPLISAGAGIATAIINRQGGSVAPVNQQMPATTRIPADIIGKILGTGTSTGQPTAMDPFGIGNVGRGYDQTLPPGTGGRPWPVTKSGKPRRRKKNGLPWKTPSMNVTNVHALRRSFRRVDGFASLAKKTITFVKTHHLKKGRKR